MGVLIFICAVMGILYCVSRKCVMSFMTYVIVLPESHGRYENTFAVMTFER